MFRSLTILLLCSGCTKKPEAEGPLGMTLLPDGVIYAGAASVDITPALGETFTDLNGNAYFDGCRTDPAASAEGCDEPFDDLNGNGIFEPTWIGGFGPLRPALEIHDPIEINVVVLSYNGQYVALAGLDLVGLSQVRINAAKDLLAVDGFEPDHLFAASTHNHQGPDTMGLWGDPYSGVTGMNMDYQQRVTEAIDEAVRLAAEDMVPVSLTVGSTHLREREPRWFNGSMFGGENPTAKMHGMINDIRDPVIVSDQVLAFQGVSDEGTVFTWTSWSGHPEVWGSQSAISSDWVGVTRDVIEDRFGGVAIHMPEALGGMQSALGGNVPLVDAGGNWAMDGDTPLWAEHDSWDFVRSHGWHIADAAVAALEGGESIEDLTIRVEAEPVIIPVTNVAYQLLGPQGLFDLGLDDAIFDLERCPEMAETGDLGCIETRTARLQMGPIGMLAVPGELLPEMAWGFPDHPDWANEAADASARGPDSTFFPQHPIECNAVSFADECSEAMSAEDCDCTKLHAVPYRLSDDPTVTPMLDAVDTPYKAVLGMSGDYLSYIVPEPDFHTGVSLFTDDGDHYEDTVSPSAVFGSRLQEAQAAIESRW